jgi:serine/threonine protein phosphatase PrpC
MASDLTLSIGQFSDKGRKEINQDFHGALMPAQPLLGAKGVAVAIADGISTSRVSRVAAETAVKSFLDDYYCTSESWSVKTSAQRVITAANSWLYGQTRRGPGRDDADKGYVCTLSALIVKGATAHLFHVGDSRIYRLAGGTLEQLTEDHRIAVSREKSYLSRALGVNPQVEIDYVALKVEAGDVFLLATDGVYDYAEPRFMAETVVAHAGNLDHAAAAIVAEALKRGSDDNLTVQIVRVDAVPEGEAREVVASDLPLPPLLEAGQSFDGYRIVRELHGSSRSHIYLAVDIERDTAVTLKVPSIDLRGDPAYLRRFAMEEWIAKRVNSPHVLKAALPNRRRSFLYVVMEYVDGQPLAQWMIDNPRPDLETVRGIVEQVARGLQALHRMEMLHQDLRPANIMIDRTGTAKIIDFGSTRVAGIEDSESEAILGTVQYTAPEYFVGEGGTTRSDQFSLAVIAYQMLTGRLPYDAKVAQARTRARQKKLVYRSALSEERDIPAWIDGALRKACAVEPMKRYGELSEFVHDLRHPNRAFDTSEPVPLMARDPVFFWQAASAILAAAVIALLVRLFHG